MNATPSFGVSMISEVPSNLQFTLTKIFGKKNRIPFFESSAIFKNYVSSIFEMLKLIFKDSQTSKKFEFG